jgi:hypothetical protein
MLVAPAAGYLELIAGGYRDFDIDTAILHTAAANVG